MKLGAPLNGYKAEDQVSTFLEAAVWLRDQACTHYPDSEFRAQIWRLRPTVGVDSSGQQPRSAAIEARMHAVAVELDFVQPI